MSALSVPTEGTHRTLPPLRYGGTMRFPLSERTLFQKETIPAGGNIQSIFAQKKRLWEYVEDYKKTGECQTRQSDIHECAASMIRSALLHIAI